MLAFGEVSSHPHMAARHSVIPVDGIEQAGAGSPVLPDPGGPPGRSPVPGTDTEAVLAEWDA